MGKQKKKKMPTVRKPISPPTIPHKSKKEYDRKTEKKVEYDKDI